MKFTSIENDNNGGLMKEGEYEVTCINAEQKVTSNGAYDIIDFEFVVRKDVEQAYGGKHIFKTFFADDKGNFPLQKIGKYAASMGIQPGKEFELHELIGENLIVVIKHYENKDGEKKECIFFTKATEHPVKVETFEAVEDDTDLPF